VIAGGAFTRLARFIALALHSARSTLAGDPCFAAEALTKAASRPGDLSLYDSDHQASFDKPLNSSLGIRACRVNARRELGPKQSCSTWELEVESWNLS